MSNSIEKIVIYYGPKQKFDSLHCNNEIKNIVEIAYETDAIRREFSMAGQAVKSEPPFYENVVAVSDDYASLSEHVISNFIGFLRSFSTTNLFLHNPPLQVYRQMEKAFGAIVLVHKHKYPSIGVEVLQKIKNEFDEHIIGQEEVKERLLSSLYPLTKHKHKKPVVLMFYGPSGVGKTETAKYISSLLESNLFRKQFSMFHNEKFASYLFGGHHSENSFANELLNRESNVILLDEFDKPNPVFHSAFYQLFDEGVFEDKNYSLEIGNAVIICTSNYKSEIDVRKNLGDPIYSRFDAVIEFKSLTINAITQIVEKTLNKMHSILLPEEQNLINISELRIRLLNNTSRLKNAREIRKIIKEAVSLQLIRSILN